MAVVFDYCIFALIHRSISRLFDAAGRKADLRGLDVDSNSTNHINGAETRSYQYIWAAAQMEVPYPNASEAGMPISGTDTSDRSWMCKSDEAWHCMRTALLSPKRAVKLKPDGVSLCQEHWL